MEFLFQKEKLLVEVIAQKNPQMAGKLQAAVGKIFIHLPEKLLSENYDASLAKEFLLWLAQENQVKGIEQYDALITEDKAEHVVGKKCLTPPALEESIFRSMGSEGITKLIQDVLQKMATSSFTDAQIETVVTLIENRNKLRQIEERFLHDAFKAYLKKQISLYEA